MNLMKLSSFKWAFPQSYFFFIPGSQVSQIGKTGKNHGRATKLSALDCLYLQVYRSVNNSIPPNWDLFPKNVTFIKRSSYNI